MLKLEYSSEHAQFPNSKDSSQIECSIWILHQRAISDYRQYWIYIYIYIHISPLDIICNSTIISSNSFYRTELAAFLAPAVGQMEAKWKLCYNALSDGWKTTIFLKNCGNKKHTVIIIKKESYIFGGYTEIPSGNVNYEPILDKSTTDSMSRLFSSRLQMTSKCDERK